LSRNSGTQTLEVASRAFVEAKVAQFCTQRTIGQYEWILTRFTRWAGERGIETVDQITSTDIRAFLTMLRSGERASSYVHGHARVIRTWLRFLEGEGLLDDNPMTRVAMPRVERKILPTFTKDELERLFAACKTTRERAMMLVLIDTGVRASEFVHLVLADIDWESGRVVVRQGKGRRDRFVFLRPQTTGAIRAYLAERSDAERHAPLFPSARTGGPLKPNGLLQFCRRLGRRASVDECHPHKFRRTFATWALRAGMNIHAVQRLMGHADLDVLLRYLNLDEADLAEAHRRYGPVDSILGATESLEPNSTPDLGSFDRSFQR
jgi:site-specific recombinase XerD